MWPERVRRRIPFAYWLFYDFVVLVFEVNAFTRLSHWYAISLVFLLVAVFFDVTEAIAKTIGKQP